MVISAPAIPGDSYENNDLQSTAYNLPLSFAGNTASRSTTGSTIHTPSDYDYYKFVLPAGYNYTINGRVHDSYNSTNGQFYTNDVLWSYNVGGIWSGAYDDVLTNGNILVNGGGTVYFKVAAYFAGNTGSYLLDLQVTRSAASGVENLDEPVHTFSLAPNPATDQAVLTWDNPAETPTQIQVYNTSGQLVHQILHPDPARIAIPVNTWTPGSYNVLITTDKNRFTKQLVVGN